MQRTVPASSKRQAPSSKQSRIERRGGFASMVGDFSYKRANAANIRRPISSIFLVLTSNAYKAADKIHAGIRTRRLQCVRLT